MNAKTKSMWCMRPIMHMQAILKYECIMQNDMRMHVKCLKKLCAPRDILFYFICWYDKEHHAWYAIEWHNEMHVYLILMRCDVW